MTWPGKCKADLPLAAETGRGTRGRGRHACARGRRPAKDGINWGHYRQAFLAYDRCER